MLLFYRVLDQLTAQDWANIRSIALDLYKQPSYAGDTPKCYIAAFLVYCMENDLEIDNTAEFETSNIVH